MALISSANLLAAIDRLAAAWTQTLAAGGTSVGGAVAGTVRGTINNLLTQVLALNDVDQELELIAGVNSALSVAHAQAMSSVWAGGALSTFNSHIARHGASVNTAISNLNTFLTYYNTTPFSALATPDFASLYATLGFNPATLSPGNVMSPAIQPDYTSTASAHGLGSYDIATTTYAHGDNVAAGYCAVVPVLEVITTFVGGGAHPTVQLAGVDDQGNACTLNAALNLGTNNPAAALSGLTVTPAISVAARATVVVSSSTGIVVGSVLVINKGLPDQEAVVVEGVPDGTHITAVFKLVHGAGATIDGWTSFLAGNLSTGAGRRLKSLNNSSGITLVLSSHSAGAVRFAGQLDRVAI